MCYLPHTQKMNLVKGKQMKTKKYGGGGGGKRRIDRQTVSFTI